MAVKADQPTLREDLTILFADSALVAATGTAARTTDKGHGRLERRTLRASDALVGYSAWPGLGQALCVEREVVDLTTGEVRRERSFAVTSLPPAAADARTLLRLWRGHWGIENRLHWVRDVGFGEDRSAARADAVPQVLAALRNRVIGLLRAHGHTALAAARRRLARDSASMLALLSLATE